MKLTPDEAASYLDKLEVLLGGDRCTLDLARSPADPAPAEVGADAGMRLRSADEPPVHALVYVGTGADLRQDVASALGDELEGDDVMVETARNGPLLMTAWTTVGDDADGIRAKYRLLELISAFSGDE